MCFNPLKEAFSCKVTAVERYSIPPPPSVYSMVLGLNSTILESIDLLCSVSTVNIVMLALHICRFPFNTCSPPLPIHQMDLNQSTLPLHAISSSVSSWVMVITIQPRPFINSAVLQKSTKLCKSESLGLGCRNGARWTSDQSS